VRAVEDDIFDISFESNGKKYTGWVNPSNKKDTNGKARSFHVVLNGVSFGHLSLNNCQWSVNDERPADLVEEVGREIEKHYAL
jgi:hypothetical protein